jgi:hypothetical protein
MTSQALVPTKSKSLAPSTVALLDEYSPDKWCTPQEVCNKFGITPKTLARWAKEDRLIITDLDGEVREVRTFRTPGSHRRYNTADIELLVEQNEDRP